MGAATPGVYDFPESGSSPRRSSIGVRSPACSMSATFANSRPSRRARFTYRRVLFDADVGIDHRVKVTAGGAPGVADLQYLDAFGNPVTLVPTRDLTGYVQIAPDESAHRRRRTLIPRLPI